MIENTARNYSPVRNLSILELSSILCIISPTFFVSKNVRGRRTIFLRKSERNSIFIFELTCNKAHERKKSIENLETRIPNCAIMISQIMFLSFS